MAAIRMLKVISGVLHVYELAGKKDDYIIAKIAQDRDLKSVPHVLTFVDGVFNFEKIEGALGDYPISIRKAGDCNLDIENKNKYLPAGQLKLTVATDTAKYYCINHPKREKLDAIPVRMQAGGRPELFPKGTVLFLAYGKVTLETVQQTVTAPYLVEVQNTAALVTPIEDSLIIQVNNAY